jgi:phage terminase large subunit GpA-like protein
MRTGLFSGIDDLYSGDVVETFVTMGGDHLVPRLIRSVSQWADEERRLVAETAAEAGFWRTERAPYQREPMDAFSDPEVRMITLCTATQVGKTEIILNMVGRTIDDDPAPTMIVLPRDEDAKGWAEKRVKPMVLACEALKARTTGLSDDLAGKLYVFDQMFLKFAGANSPADLASDPIKNVLMDEVEKYPVFSGRESSPPKLAEERTRTFPDRKIVQASTPRLENGYIWTALKRSDWRRWWVPCARCGAYQPMTFRPDDKLGSGALRWEKGALADDIREARAAVWYQCGPCGGRIETTERMAMLKAGVWVPKGLTCVNGKVKGRPRQNYHRGYHLSALCSMWVEWESIVAEFLEAKGKREELMGFVNSVLAEPWIETSEERVVLDPLKRQERYSGYIPKGVLLLTCGVDVQDDRIECELVGWGMDEESWNIEYFVWYGNPGLDEVWENVTALKRRKFKRVDGIEMTVNAMTIDSGGHHTQKVYDYVRPKQIEHVWAVKGGSEISPRVLAGKAKTNVGQVVLWLIGTQVAKDLIYARLRLDQVGPGFCHFPETRDKDYFDGLTAERVQIAYRKGFMVRTYIKTGTNEPLDCRVYAYVALLLLAKGGGIAWADIKAQLDAEAEALKPVVVENTEPPVDTVAQSTFPSDVQKREANLPRRRGGFVKGWRK